MNDSRSSGLNFSRLSMLFARRSYRARPQGSDAPTKCSVRPPLTSSEAIAKKAVLIDDFYDCVGRFHRVSRRLD